MSYCSSPRRFFLEECHTGCGPSSFLPVGLIPTSPPTDKLSAALGCCFRSSHSECLPNSFMFQSCLDPSSPSLHTVTVAPTPRPEASECKIVNTHNLTKLTLRCLKASICSHSLVLRRISAACPACRAPMVGTRPTVPDSSARAARSVAAVVTTRTVSLLRRRPPVRSAAAALRHRARPPAPPVSPHRDSAAAHGTRSARRVP